MYMYLPSVVSYKNNTSIIMFMMSSKPKCYILRKKLISIFRVVIVVFYLWIPSISLSFKLIEGILLESDLKDVLYHV